VESGILHLENIGGLKGDNSFKFKKGSLNIVEAPNSSGKTSIVKALASILSATDNGNFKPLIEEEAKNLGLRSNKRNPQQGFVNVHSEVGRVKLDLDEKSLDFVVKQNGEILQSHEYGNQDFLLAGILSNDSRILKQLNSVEGDEIEPGDFYWAVTELSSAKIYDDERNFLLEKKEEYSDEFDLAEQKIYFLEDSENDLKKLKEERKLLEKETKKFEKIISEGGIARLVEKKGDLYTKLNTIEKQKSSILAPKENNESQIKEIENQINKLKNDYTTSKSKIKDIDGEIMKLQDQKNDLEDQKNNQIPKLQEALIPIDGEMNIYVTALSSLKEQNNEVNCPLCKTGTISFPIVQQRYDELKNDKKNITNQIKEINMSYHEVKNRLSNLQQKKQTLDEELNEISTFLQQKENHLKNLRSLIKQQLTEIDRYDKKIENTLKSLEEINVQVSGDDEKLMEELDEKQLQLRDNQLKINEISKEREKASIDIGGESFKPKEAKKKFEKIIDFIEKAIEFTKKRSDDQKQKAKVNFNQNIESLIKKLGFKEFRSIKLNDNYQLYVERLDESSGEYVLQQVKTLSTSEKSAISLILQIALKQMYIPDLDFLILDDVLANFDEDKKFKVLDYLSDKAKEEGWFIILTTLTDAEQPLEVKTW